MIQRLIELLKKERKILKRKNSPVRDEYRYNIETQHMNYVYLVEKDGEKETYHSLGFTHKDTYEAKKICLCKKIQRKAIIDLLISETVK